MIGRATCQWIRIAPSHADRVCEKSKGFYISLYRPEPHHPSHYTTRHFKTIGRATIRSCDTVDPWSSTKKERIYLNIESIALHSLPFSHLKSKCYNNIHIFKSYHEFEKITLSRFSDNYFTDANTQLPIIIAPSRESRIINWSTKIHINEDSVKIVQVL